MQGQRAPSRSCTRRSIGANLPIALGKLHLHQRLTCILDGSPARTAPALWTGHGLGFPIDIEVREVVAGLSLIPVGLERGTNQVHFIAGLALDEMSDRDIACIDEMLLGEQLLLSQVGMDRGEDSLIAEAEQQWSRHG